MCSSVSIDGSGLAVGQAELGLEDLVEVAGTERTNGPAVGRRCT